MKKPAPIHPDDPGYGLSLAAQRAARHVIQLFDVPVGKRPTLFGNALMVSHLGRLFLISAGHVLNTPPQAGRSLHYFDKTGRGLARLRMRGIAFTQGSVETNGKDVLDLAVGELLSAYPSTDLKEPLDSSLIGPLGPPAPDSVYVATGFPSSRAKADPSKQRLTTVLSAFRTTLAESVSSSALQANPQLQIVLSLNIERMSFPDGSVGAIADPAGMSGSPVWLLKDGELKCAGILTEHHRSKKLLVATHIAVGLHLVERALERFPMKGENGFEG